MVRLAYRLSVSTKGPEVPIPFTCPHCGVQRVVGDEYAGQSGNCAGCHQPITIPGLAAVGDGVAPPPQTGQVKGTLYLILGVVGLMACLCGGGLALLLVPAFSSARQRAYRMRSNNHLKQIGLSLLNYEVEYRCLPASSLADEATGKPPHSWRVALLEFVDPELYSQYDFSKPWDDPVNKRLESKMPDIYQNPQIKAPPYHTNYLAVVGERTVLAPNRFRRLAEITDGNANTVVIVEAEKAVHWMEPSDLRVNDLTLDEEDLVGMPQGLVEDGLVLFVDGHVTDVFFLRIAPGGTPSPFIIDDGAELPAGDDQDPFGD